MPFIVDDEDDDQQAAARDVRKVEGLVFGLWLIRSPSRFGPDYCAEVIIYHSI